MNYYNSISGRNALKLGDYLSIISNNNDLSYLVKNHEENYPKEEDLQLAWDNIKEECIDVVGISDSCLQTMRMVKEMAITRAEIITTGNEELITDYEIQLSQFETQQSNNKKQTESITAYQQLAYVEKFFGFQFNLESTPVIMWLNYLKIFNTQKNG